MRGPTICWAGNERDAGRSAAREKPSAFGGGIKSRGIELGEEERDAERWVGSSRKAARRKIHKTSCENGTVERVWVVDHEERGAGGKDWVGLGDFRGDGCGGR